MELRDNTTCSETTQNGVKGCLLTASNGNNIFLPVAGYYIGSSLNEAEFEGRYWANSIYENPNSPNDAWNLRFNLAASPGVSYSNREHGFPVRAVRTTRKN